MRASSADIELPNLAQGFLQDNLGAVGLSGTTLGLIQSSLARGEILLLPGDTPVVRLNGNLLDAPPDDDQLRRTASEVESRQGVLVVFGLGLGHTVRRLRAHTDAPIVVYEPDPGLLRTALEFGPADFGGVQIVCTTHDLTQIWPSATRRRTAATLVRTPGYAEAFPDEHGTLASTVQQLVERTGVNDITYRNRARQWIEHIFENLELLGESPLFLALSGHYPNVPAFIVGAGPSLSKNGPRLSQAAQKGIVIAVNSSGRALASYGVEPQVLACMESIDVSHLIRDLPFLDRVVRAFSLTANPATLRTGRGPLLPIYEGLPEVSVLLQQLTGHVGLPVCGSVSTVAFSLAHRLGCNPIVMVGHDLAYTGGRAYAPGSPYETSRARVSDDGACIEVDWSHTLLATHAAAGSTMGNREPHRSVEAWGGKGSVPSGAAFCAVRNWLEQAARALRDSSADLRLVNATEGGARIEGFEETGLEELLRSLPEVTITSESIARDAAAAAAPLPPSAIVAWSEAQARLCETARRAARRLRRLTEHAQRAVDRGQPKAVSSSFSALEAAERQLREAVAEAPVLDAWGFAPVDQAMSREVAGGDAQDSAKEGLRQEAAVAAAVESSAQQLQQQLKEVRDRLRQRSR